MLGKICCIDADLQQTSAISHKYEAKNKMYYIYKNNEPSLNGLFYF